MTVISSFNSSIQHVIDIFIDGIILTMERRLYTPVEYIQNEMTRPVIFLAGPIQMAQDWQKEAFEIIKKLNRRVIIASPKREYKAEDFDYGKQVDWETFHLRRAASKGTIMFWLPKESYKINGRAYVQTSRIELGEWKVRHERDGTKLTVGIEPGFSGEKYIRRRFGQDCPEVPIFDNLADTCYSAVELANGKPGSRSGFKSRSGIILSP